MSVAYAAEAPVAETRSAEFPEPRTLKDLDALFEGAVHPSAIPIVLTPGLAKLLLRRNKKNRNIRPATVTDYARDMAVFWPLNGEAIKIARNGDVLDGQHRLHACEKADTSILTFIVGNLPPETQDTMDSGMRRTTADVLTLRDEDHSTALAAILRRVWGGIRATGSSPGAIRRRRLRPRPCWERLPKSAAPQRSPSGCGRRSRTFPSPRSVRPTTSSTASIRMRRPGSFSAWRTGPSFRSVTRFSRSAPA